MPLDHNPLAQLALLPTASSSSAVDEIPPTLCEMPRSGALVEIRASRALDAPLDEAGVISDQPLKIRALHRSGGLSDRVNTEPRGSASAASPGALGYSRVVDGLVRRRYSWRGYGLTDQQQDAVCLSMTQGGQTLATITVSVDGPRGLKLEKTFPKEVAAKRALGHRLCEFSRLATEPELRSRRALARLFHVAHVVAHELMGAQILLIEVNPRHVSYYERMLCFTRCDSAAMNQDVGAPAVLMELDLEKAEQQSLMGVSAMGMYRDFFSTSQAKEIAGKLRQQLAAKKVT